MGRFDFPHQNLGVPDILIECDALTVVEACRSQKPVGEIQHLIQDILAIKRSFTSCGFTWIKREGNSAAHTLAALEASGSLTRNWVVSPPELLRSILRAEKPASSQLLSRM
ncbi:Ribonuclease H-like superfamily [Sesbania bispinosa]|nr:Ribonuclease H-like superfamily [Sesbania bispinosa]